MSAGGMAEAARREPSVADFRRRAVLAGGR